MNEDPPVTDEALAELADAILDIARKLALRNPDRREIVPLTGTEVEVIRAVQRSPGTTATEVAAVTGLRRSNISVAIRVLEAQGLLEKNQSATDARVIELNATDYALENMERIRALWVRRLREAPADVLQQSVETRRLLRTLESYLTR